MFNWLIAGTDAHAKNYSFLLAGNQIRLAPLYDIASVLPYDDTNGYKVNLAMKVDGDYGLRRTDRRSAWEHAADELNLNRDKLIARAVDLAERLVELVTDRSERCRAGLG